MKRVICSILASILVVVAMQSSTVYAKDYSKYSTKAVAWGLGQNKEHKTPGGSYPYSGFSMKQYDAYYVGKRTKKEIYLTIDCGYENGNTKGMLDTLKKYNVKACFFVTKNFVETQPGLVKRMKKEGHLVGNHTMNHICIGNSSVKKIQGEVKGLEKLMKEKTGYKLDKVMRPPEGVYSERSLKVVQDMGYKTIFWSLAWKDWEPTQQPSVDYVVGGFKTYYHKGMIPLMHCTSSADRKALPKVIKFMRSKGYTFYRLDEAFLSTPKVKVSVKNTIYTGKTPEVIVTTKSKGKKQYTFYKKVGKKKKKIKAPKATGSYYVCVSIAQTKKYRAVEKWKEFSIKKAETIIKIDMPEVIFVGEEYEPAIVTNNKKGKVSVAYYNENDEIIEKPTEVGNYKLTIKIGSSKNFKAKTETIAFVICEKNERIIGGCAPVCGVHSLSCVIGNSPMEALGEML